MGSMRIGFGYDSHRFDEARSLVLGGVRIPDHPGLLGHSDGDAIAHAVTDALLGAAALGDIGRLFPPSEPRWKDADSMELLARAVELIGESDLRVCNLDVTVITEQPKDRPQRARDGSAARRGAWYRSRGDFRQREDERGYGLDRFR